MFRQASVAMVSGSRLKRKKSSRKGKAIAEGDGCDDKVGRKTVYWRQSLSTFWMPPFILMLQKPTARRRVANVGAHVFLQSHPLKDARISKCLAIQQSRQPNVNTFFVTLCRLVQRDRFLGDPIETMRALTA